MRLRFEADVSPDSKTRVDVERSRGLKGAAVCPKSRQPEKKEK